MTVSLPTIVLAGSGLLACATPPRSGWRRNPRDGACFYRDVDYRGPYFCIGGNDQLDTLPRGVSDNISSVKVLGRARSVCSRTRASAATRPASGPTFATSTTGTTPSRPSRSTRPAANAGTAANRNVDQVIRRAYRDMLQEPDTAGMRTCRTDRRRLDGTGRAPGCGRARNIVS